MTILFDIDGTLIDHDSAEEIAVEALRLRLGLTEDAKSFCSRWRAALERHYDRYLVRELTLQGQRRERLREVIGPTLSGTDADRLSARYLEDYLAACQPYADVMPTLKRLAGFEMGIISNGARGQQEGKLVRAGIAHYFNMLILSDECGVAKPAPAIFHLACTTMKSSPLQTLYVGDRRDMDAEAASHAGLHGIWLDRNGAVDGHDSQFRINSLVALPSVMERLERI